MISSDYRRIARTNLKGNWPLSIAVAAVALLLGGIVTGTSFIPETEINMEYEDLHNFKEFLLLVKDFLPMLTVSGILGLVAFIIGGTVQLGHAQYLLNQHDGAPIDLKLLFSKFDHFGAGFLQALLRGIFVFLWSLLFVIPGIVAALSYSMTPFIMAENPDMTPSEAIAASKEMMNGHKWRLFCLDFSFFGWTLLCSLTMNIGYLALNPYTCAAYAAFYRDISAPPAVETCQDFTYTTVDMIAE